MNSEKSGAMDFNGKVVIVTGGGYGIGQQAALSFGKLGANVVLAARSTDKIEKTASLLAGMGTDPLAVTTDISIEEDVEMLTRKTVEKYGRIDVLVNNSAIAGPTASICDISAQDWKQTIDINLTGSFFCCKHVGKVMRDQKHGNVVMLTSTSGRSGYPLRSPYCSTRWAVIGLAKTMAMELGPFGVNVNVVMPGPVEGQRVNDVFQARADASGRSVDDVRDEFTKSAALGRLVSEQEVCDAILYASSSLSSGMQGQIIQIDAGRRI